MQGWVCAYCLKELADGDEVEHFRPKSVYWWLAYDFSNYFLACHRCNRGSVKGTRFPLAEEAERTTWAARDRLDDEPRLVADPVCDPVEDWFTVDVLEGSCPVEVRPSVDRASRAFSVAQRSIELGWLLAVIARDPPALDSARIERWLAERELLAWVSEFRARLR